MYRTILAVAAALSFGLPVLAEEYAQEPFELSGAIEAGEAWTVEVGFTQRVGNEVEQTFTLTGVDRVTGVENDLLTVESTITGLSMRQVTPQGLQEQAYGAEDFETIYTRTGESVPFAHTYSVQMDRGFEILDVEGYQDTLNQLFDYLIYRGFQQEVLPAWIQLLPSEVRDPLRASLRELFVGVAEDLLWQVTDMWSAQVAPATTVLWALHEGDTLEPKQEIGAVTYLGMRDGHAHFEGTTQLGDQPMPATLHFSLDGQGRLVQLQVAQTVSGMSPTGEAMQVTQELFYRMSRE